MSSSLLFHRLFSLSLTLSMTTFAAVASTSTAQAETAKYKISKAVERRGDLARNARRPARPLKGILKTPRVGQHKLGGGRKTVRFQETRREMLERRGNMARAARKPARGIHRGAKAARHADRARKARNTARAVKLARGAKYLAAGTGVGAVVGVTAGLAGVDPIEMAALKATNPAEYQRRMRDLKKNPVKYMGNNIKNNGRKIGRGVKNGTRKLGQGVKRVFAKKN
jgi:hypothetical protein